LPINHDYLLFSFAEEFICLAEEFTPSAD